jgi:hypothetical protein
MEFYKRELNPKDFQTPINTGQTEFPYLLDQKLSIRILLTQNIEDIGFYETYKKTKGPFDLLDSINMSEILK